MNIQVSISEESRLISGFATVSISIPELESQDVLDIDFLPLYDAFGEPNAVTLDLVLIASICYVIDKCVPRRSAEDSWTRELQVQLPVSDPAAWESVGEKLADCLTFLTGDEWEVSFTQAAPDIFSPPRPRRTNDRDHEPKEAWGAVSLFSGGLDSFTGVVNYLEQHEGSMFLVGHHDATGPAGDQNRLHRQLDSLPRYMERTRILPVRVRLLPAKLARPGQIVHRGVQRGDREQTLRSRSFLFMALGLFAARAVGEQIPLLVPENGYIALNIPATLSRVGTCSTRTTHPFFMNSVRDLFEALGFENTVVNPFEFQTKGEVLADCASPEVLQRLALETVSCAHASRRTIWVRRGARNCGYCVPCLIRRAALHRVGMDDGKQYGIDVLAEEKKISATVASDLFAILNCVREVSSRELVEERVLMTGPIPRADHAEYVSVVERGLAEIRALVNAKATRDLRSRAGLR